MRRPALRSRSPFFYDCTVLRTRVLTGDGEHVRAVAGRYDMGFITARFAV